MNENLLSHFQLSSNHKQLTLEARRAYTYHGVLGRQFDVQIKKIILTQFYNIIATRNRKYKGVLLFLRRILLSCETCSPLWLCCNNCGTAT